MDKQYRRCVICDYFEGGEEKDNRKFIFDSPSREHHCIKCADSIQEVAGRGYWKGHKLGVVFDDDNRFGRAMESDGDPLWSVSTEASKITDQQTSEGQGTLDDDTSIPGPRRGTGGLRERGVLPPRLSRGWPVAPTSADLEAIEREWEDLLREMDLAEIEEVD